MASPHQRQIAVGAELTFAAGPPAQILRVWTGGYPATLPTAGGQEYLPGAIEAGPFGSPAVEGARRLQLALRIATETDLRRFVPLPPAHPDPGPIPITVRWFLQRPVAASGNAGSGWIEARKFEGRCALARLAGGVCELTLASLAQDRTEVAQSSYSNADQQSKYPGDRGLEYAQQLAAGDPYQDWPPL